MEVIKGDAELSALAEIIYSRIDRLSIGCNWYDIGPHRRKMYKDAVAALLNQTELITAYWKVKD